MALVGAVHDRMPVMLLPEDYARRLDNETPPSEPRTLLCPHDPDLMKAYEVSRAVNLVRNDTEQCITPLADTKAAAG